MKHNSFLEEADNDEMIQLQSSIKMHSLLDISQTHNTTSIHKTNTQVPLKGNLLQGAYPIEPLRLYQASSVHKQESNPSHANSCFSSLQ